MSDITKCSGEGCPAKDTCYRFTAPSGMLQSFFVTPPIEDGECEMYWGESAQQIYKQLKEIFKTNEK
jgi:hypothetical protein